MQVVLSLHTTHPIIVPSQLPPVCINFGGTEIEVGKARSNAAELISIGSSGDSVSCKILAVEADATTGATVSWPGADFSSKDSVESRLPSVVLSSLESII